MRGRRIGMVSRVMSHKQDTADMTAYRLLALFEIQ